MRTETYFASAALVTQFEQTGRIAHVHHDGGDIIHIELRSHEHVLIHLIESSIPLPEVLGTLDNNRAHQHYTLFLFWADRLLPPPGETHVIEAWMRPLLALYGDRLYGYEVHGRRIFVFPVYFDGTSSLRRTRYGAYLDASRLVCRTADIHRAGLDGTYCAADFGDPHTPPPPPPHPLAAEYARLGVATDADLKAIKLAYRRLARRYHPDVNRDPGAHLHMQQINEAYRRIAHAYVHAHENSAGKPAQAE